MSSFGSFAKKQYYRLHHLNAPAAALLYMPLATRRHLSLRIGDDHLDIISDKRAIRLAHRHQIYAQNVIEQFEFYYSAVRPISIRGYDIVDYSTPRYHDVIGYDLHPILFPSLAEPIATTEQYVAFSRIKDGDCVLDLGAYSGLTSILFDQLAGPSGRVIAVDADSENIEYAKRNLSLYKSVTGRHIDIEYGALWHSDGKLEFSTEGNMGSSAASIVGGDRGLLKEVPSLTLTTLARRYNLDRIDFIKCDIEGAEAVIFDQPEFFARFRPRMIVEVHQVGGELTTAACRAALEPYGYECKEIPQAGTELPLLQCSVA